MCKYVLLLCAVMGAGALHAQEPILSSQTTAEQVQKKRSEYQRVIASLEAYRVEQWKKYQAAGAGEKQRIIVQVRDRITQDLCNEIFPAWYGTQWAFSGTSRVPGEGQIACGYFVSTCLLHAGFKVQRVKLAQQASQKIIDTMTGGKKDISAGKSMDDILARLKKSGDGIYIFGLDQHVGFVTVKGSAVRFVHSSYYRPGDHVVSEPAVGRNPLNDSNYRVFGKLLDDKMLVTWMRGDAFNVK